MKEKQSLKAHDIGPTIKTDFLQITVSVANQSDAISMIRLLTEKRLVACAQVQGSETAMTTEDETYWRCRFKTSKDLIEQVRSEVGLILNGKRHTFTSLPIVKGSAHFLNWLRSELNN